MSDEEITDAELVEPAPAPTTAALVPAGVPVGALVRPVAGVDVIRGAFQEYANVRRALVTDADEMSIQGKKFVTKSGWRKLAVAMSVSGEMVSREYDRDDQGRIIGAEVIMRAVAPNGRSMDGLGRCDFRERCCPKAYGDDEICRNSANRHTHCKAGCDGFNHFSKPQHDIPATAFTRALNRACSDLFGFGEVSAEEVTDREEPAVEADWHAILAGLNSIAEENGQRKGAKLAFLSKFGKPDELTKGQLDAARRMVIASGGTIPDPAGASATATEASSTGTPTVAGTPAPSTTPPGDVESTAGPAGEVNGDGHVGNAPGPVPSPNQSEGDDQAASIPPRSTVDEPPDQEPPPGEPTAGAAPHLDTRTARGRESDKRQRQMIGIRVAELEKAGLLQAGDKKEIVELLTHDRTGTTTEMGQSEAVKMIAVLAFLKNGALVMEDDASGGRMLRPMNEQGNDFLKTIIFTASPAAQESEVM